MKSVLANTEWHLEGSSALADAVLRRCWDCRVQNRLSIGDVSDSLVASLHLRPPLAPMFSEAASKRPRHLSCPFESNSGQSGQDRSSLVPLIYLRPVSRLSIGVQWRSRKSLEFKPTEETIRTKSTSILVEYVTTGTLKDVWIRPSYRSEPCVEAEQVHHTKQHTHASRKFQAYSVSDLYLYTLPAHHIMATPFHFRHFLIHNLATGRDDPTVVISSYSRLVKKSA